MLGPREAHLWCVRPDEIVDQRLLRDYFGLLSASEREQHGRFVFDHLKHDYLVTRALVRTTLSRYVDVLPVDWVFRINDYGRPAIASPALPTSLRFNISHTRGLIVCLVAWDREIGVDVEDLQRTGRTVEIAEDFFSPAEAAALHARPSSTQRRRFFELWTLKEAYIKARGMGLSIPLDQFSYDLDAPDGTIHLSFDPRLRDTPARWQLCTLPFTARHQLSIALCRQGVDLEILMRFTRPLEPAHEEEWRPLA